MIFKSYLALLAASVPMSVFAIKQDFSGSLRFDMQLLSRQEGAQGSAFETKDPQFSHDMLVSQARLRWVGHLAKNWRSHLQVQKKEYSNDQIGLHVFQQPVQSFQRYIVQSDSQALSFEIAEASVAYQWTQNIEFRLGQIPLTAVSASQTGYQPAIGQYPYHQGPGDLFGPLSYRPGVALETMAGPLRFDVSIWQQSPYRRVWDLVDYGNAIAQATTQSNLDAIEDALLNTQSALTEAQFRSKNVTLSYASRAMLVFNTQPHTHWALGLGYALRQLNMPIIVACVGAYDLGNAPNFVPPNYQISAYNRLIEFGLDATRVYDRSLFQIGYQYQRLRQERAQHYYYHADPNPNAGPALAAEDLNATARSQAFDNNGLAHSFWLQSAYLLWGQEYHVDLKNGSVAGIATNPRYGALEVYGRLGLTTRQNILALLNIAAWDDFSTKDGADPLDVAQPELSRIQTVSLSDTAQYLLVTVDNTGSQAQTTVLKNNSGVAYQAAQRSYTLGLSYALTPESLFKLEYEHHFRTFQKSEEKGMRRDSLKMRHQSTLRLQWDFHF